MVVSSAKEYAECVPYDSIDNAYMLFWAEKKIRALSADKVWLNSELRAMSEANSRLHTEIAELKAERTRLLELLATHGAPEAAQTK